MKTKPLVLLIMLLFFLSGCATVDFTKKGVHYQERASGIQSIAVLPVDFKIYQINASGVPEEMDEWSHNIKEMIQNNLKDSLNGRNLSIKFIDDQKLKSMGYDTWLSQKGLFEAIAASALNHAYPGGNGFESKIKNFDYTMGPDIQQLSSFTGADALLFIYGFDSVRSTGRFWMEALQGAVLGVYYNYFSGLEMGLVDAHTGEVLWFKANNSGQERDYRNPKLIKSDIKWFIEDFLTKN